MLVSLAVGLFNLFKTKALECVSVINQKCMSRPKTIDLNKDELIFYPLSIKVNKCGGNCNNINDPMAKLCVPDTVKDVNIKVFNLLARINDTRKILWYETCKCVCRLTSAVCNDRQEWNKNKCICECKEYLIGKFVCDKGYMWNPSTCICEYDKYCEIGQYLDYKNCVCRKKLIDDLIEQCTRIIDMEIQNNNSSNITTTAATSKTYFALFIVFLVLFILLFAGCIYYWRKHNNETITKKIYDATYLGAEKSKF